MNSFQFKEKSVLSKYDEEIEGEKKKSFRLSAGGFVGGERERELQTIRENLRSQAHSLDMPSLTLATEYYTPQEMVSSICFQTVLISLRGVTKIRSEKQIRDVQSEPSLFCLTLLILCICYA